MDMRHSASAPIDATWEGLLMPRRRLQSDHPPPDPARDGSDEEEGEEGGDDEDIISDLLDAGAEQRTYILSKDSRFRLDQYLQNRLKGISRSQVQRLISLGGVTVNGSPAKPATRLKEGDEVEVVVPPRPSDDLLPEPISVEILHEETGFIVVNKPANLIVHPARGRQTGTLLNALAYHFQQQSALSGQGSARAEEEASGLSKVGAETARPGVIHRLDKDTTGVMVVGKREAEHWAIAKQFEARTNLKVYLAVVHGTPDPPGGAVDQPIGRHPTIREAMAVRHDSMSRDALTLYRVRERYRGYSLVELEIKTGRTHQIRVHLQYQGHPIVGDIIYGGEPVGPAELATPPTPAAYRPHLTFARTKEEGLKVEAHAAERMKRDDMFIATPALHAALLGINHPVTGERVTFTAPVPDPMRSLISRLREQPAPGEVVQQGWHVDLGEAVRPL